ncbi:MAG: metallophosphoesterase [Bradymonadales bacterium]
MKKLVLLLLFLSYLGVSCSDKVDIVGLGEQCAADLQRCGTDCVNLQSDVQNCGRCTYECGEGSCVLGQCRCFEGYVACESELRGVCVAQSDDLCGELCVDCVEMGKICVAGRCVCEEGLIPCGPDGRCVGQSDDLCGEDCSDCSILGDSCEGGVCSESDDNDLQIPSKRPSQISMSLGRSSELSKSSLSFSWITSADTQGGELIWGDAPELKGAVTRVEAEQRKPVASDILPVSQQVLFRDIYAYTAHVTGLLPGASYYYKIGNPVDGYSKIRQFRAPLAESTADAFDFIACPDTLSSAAAGYGHVKKLFKNIFLAQADAAFMLHLGNITQDGGDSSLWQQFYAAARNFLLKIPLMAAAGVHDGGSARDLNFVQMKARLNYDHLETPSALSNAAKGSVYSFEYGNALFVVLNATLQGEDESLQWQFLEEQAQKSSKRWRIAVLNIPPYNVGHHYRVNNVVGSILSSAGIDLLLSGYERSYFRTSLDTTDRVDDETSVLVRVSPESGAGTTYVIAGTATGYYRGEHERERDTWMNTFYYDLDRENADVLMYGKVSVGADAIEYKQFLGDDVIDSFRITKSRREFDAEHEGKLRSVGVVGSPERDLLLKSSISPKDAQVSYVWERSNDGDTWNAIAGASSSSYAPNISDAGKLLRVTATGTGDYKGTVTSLPTAKLPLIHNELEGSGSESEPYLIHTEDDLRTWLKLLNAEAPNYIGKKYFKLTSNIVLSPQLPGYSNLPMLKRFSGVFDGDGHSISQLRQSFHFDTAKPHMAGMFGELRDGEIKNLKLMDAQLRESDDSTHPHLSNDVGVLVGVMTGSSKISRCEVRGRLFGSKSVGNGGGIVGKVHSATGSIEDSLFVGSVTAHNRAAGIAAYIAGNGQMPPSFAIQRCLAKADVTTTATTLPDNQESSRVAGIIAGFSDANGASVQNCVAFDGKITHAQDAQGYFARVCAFTTHKTVLAGNLASEDVTLADSNGNAENFTPVGAQNNVNGLSKKRAELNAQATYESLGWDFNSVWKIDMESEHPVLGFKSDEPHAKKIVFDFENGALLPSGRAINATATVSYKSLSYTLDENPIAMMPLDTSALHEGSYTLEVTMVDNNANTHTASQSFTIFTDALTLYHAKSHSDDEAKHLSVKAKRNAGGYIDVDFYEASTSLNVKYLENTTDDLLLRQAHYPGESLNTLESGYYSTTALNAMPYQVFEISTNDIVGKTDLHYLGHSIVGERLALFAYDYSASAWQLLDSAVSEHNSNLELSASIDNAKHVRFGKIRAMVAPHLAANGADSFVQIGDTQNYTCPVYFVNGNPNGIYLRVMQWLRDQYLAANIAYVHHVGDLVEASSGYDMLDTEWSIADQAHRIIDDLDIPNGISVGNHDNYVKTNSENYNVRPHYDKYFPASRYQNKFWYGGGLDNNYNSYTLVTIAERDFIFLNMGFASYPYAWAKRILKRYKHRIAVITKHNYLAKGERTHEGRLVFEQIVVPNRNVLLVLCGHVTERDYLISNIDSQDGRQVIQIVVDHSNYYPYPDGLGAEGYLRIIKLHNNEIINTTYSPYRDQYLTVADGPGEEWKAELLLPDSRREIHTKSFTAGSKTSTLLGSKRIENGERAELTLSKNPLNAWFAVAKSGKLRAESGIIAH